MKKWLIITPLALLVILYGWNVMSHYNEPTYRVIESQGNIEIRAYEPTVIAEVEVTGNRDTAIREGFRLLADYIFGNNQTSNTAEATSKKIAMTAPVLQQSSQKIAMTTPVMQTPNNNEWLVRFVMPKEYTLETLPKPHNPKVHLRNVPATTVVVVRFSGGSSPKNLQHHLSELQAYTAAHQLNVTGEPTYAFYNPPWTLPFLRRNEIMLTTTAAKASSD